MKLLPVAKEHLWAIAALEKEIFPDPWSETSLELLLGEQGSGVVLLEEGRLAAYAGMLHAPDEGQVTNIAVDPQCRRRGYGRAVTQALLEQAHKQGFSQVSLEVRVSNLPAISLYEGLGFAVAGRRRGFYRSPTEDALVMICRLTEENKKESL